MLSVSSLTLLAETSAAAEENAANGACLNLPRMFNMPTEYVRHGLTLKNLNNGDDDAEDDDSYDDSHVDSHVDSIENKIVLLIPEVECEAEIQEDKIYPIPAALKGTPFSALFNGIQFNSGLTVSGNKGAPILLLDPARLIKSVQQEAS